VQFDPGFRFCSGLYARYTNDAPEALKQLNLARKVTSAALLRGDGPTRLRASWQDGRWGREALINMIELYINPGEWSSAT
jgi:hypothetical protein